MEKKAWLICICCLCCMCGVSAPKKNNFSVKRGVNISHWLSQSNVCLLYTSFYSIYLYYIDANILFIVASLSFSFGYIIFFYGIDSFFGYDP